MTNHYCPLTLDELQNVEYTGPEWLVENLFRQGQLVLLSGREKSGKGLLTIDLVASIAEGTPFLGAETAQGTAIYCSGEKSLGEVKSRIAARVGERTDLPIFVLPLDGSTEDTLDLTNAQHVARLSSMIEQHRPRLVVLDVLREFHNCKEDSADEMAPLMRALRSIAHRTGCTILVNHHMSKKGEARGSTAITAAADALLNLQPDSEGSGELRGTLEARGRSVPKHSVRISLGEGGRWVARESSAPGTTKASSEDKVLRLLRAAPGPLGTQQIADGVHLSHSAVANVLAKLERQSPSLILKEPRRGQGGGFLYRIRFASGDDVDQFSLEEHAVDDRPTPPTIGPMSSPWQPGKTASFVPAG
jgi:hypothetical protein